MSDLLKDFDILAPPKRTARIGGEDIDVSLIPARASLMFIDFSKKYSVETLKSMDGNSFDSGMIENMLDVIELVCKRSSKKITKDWLLDNVDIKVLMQFVQFVFEAIKNGEEGTATTGGDGKN